MPATVTVTTLTVTLVLAFRSALDLAFGRIGDFALAALLRPGAVSELEELFQDGFQRRHFVACASTNEPGHLSVWNAAFAGVINVQQPRVNTVLKQR
ncbi:Uncharacterised protein [Burkholderia pseudomallei]|nr:Uncharacterised protein [Burkholderia pseudomallei]CAK1307575.1 Uncharacterised protein [Burkholderia pseudomallei]CPG54527.1 Uncharacterised protein [Burkholderia pseudomallei]